MTPPRDSLRPGFRILLAALALLIPTRAAWSGPAGLVVEALGQGGAADRGGVRPNDRLVSAVVSQGRTRQLRSAFDVTEIETEEGVHGAVALEVIRDGARLRLTIPGGRWDLFTRPILDDAALAAWKRAADAIQAKDVETAIASWPEAFASLPTRQWRERATLWMRLGQIAGHAEQWATSRMAYDTARKELERDRPRYRGIVWSAEASLLSAKERHEEAERCAGEAIRALEVEHESLFLASALGQLGRTLKTRGKSDEAGHALRRALAISEGLAPDSLAVATSMFNLGYWAANSGAPDAPRCLEAAHRIRERLAPGSLEHAESVRGLYLLAARRGDLVAGEALAEEVVARLEALAPASADMAVALANLGLIAAQVKHDSRLGEQYERRALRLFEAAAPGSRGHADALDNLGTILADRGDLDAAERALQRSKAMFDNLAPNTHYTRMLLVHLGWLATLRRDWSAAEQFYREAGGGRPSETSSSSGLAWALVNLGQREEARRISQAAVDEFRVGLVSPYNLSLVLLNHGRILRGGNDLDGSEAAYCEAADWLERLAPDSLSRSVVIADLGEVLLRRGNLDGAAFYLERAVEDISARASDTTFQAEALYRLALVRRGQRRLRESADLFRRAVDAIEMQGGRLGGSGDARSGFAASFRDCYHDYIELLIELGQEKDAFDMSERYRARAFLAMLAERDVTFAGELPDDLSRRWTDVDRRYSQVQAELSASTLGSDSPERLGMLRTRLRELVAEKEEVKRGIRAASPRVAALRDPHPLSWSDAAKQLEPDAALLSFVVGKSDTLLFVLKHEATTSSFAVRRLPVGESELRERIRKLVDQTRDGRTTDEAAKTAEGLYRDLIAPAESLLSKTNRLLLVPDGPLHRLPFACLVRRVRNDRPEYLVQRWATHSVLSATVYDEIVKARASVPGRSPLVAFGDPVYPNLQKKRSDELALANLRSAVRFANGLAPLPFTRTEVTNIARLYDAESHIFVGETATEEQAKTSSPNARYLHFACHGVLDENSPINSGLVLTVPPDPKEGEDDGLLQAWEIIEKVRLDADLVTLSACETGLGKEEGGEGLIGLTRAFQYAGARSVLASLWAVSDESTADLMTRFYGHLRSGMPKVLALRAAQLEMLGLDYLVSGDRMRDIGGRSGASRSKASDPFRWAPFQIAGDWR